MNFGSPLQDFLGENPGIHDPGVDRHCRTTPRSASGSAAISCYRPCSPASPRRLWEILPGMGSGQSLPENNPLAYLGCSRIDAALPPVSRIRNRSRNRFQKHLLPLKCSRACWQRLPPELMEKAIGIKNRVLTQPPPFGYFSFDAGGPIFRVWFRP